MMADDMKCIDTSQKYNELYPNGEALHQCLENHLEI